MLHRKVPQISAIIVLPVRDLALQVSNVLDKFCKSESLKKALQERNVEVDKLGGELKQRTEDVRAAKTESDVSKIQEVEATRAEVESLKKSLQERTSEIDATTVTVENLKQTINKLTTESQTQSESDKLTSQLKSTEDTLNALQSEYTRLKLTMHSSANVPVADGQRLVNVLTEKNSNLEGCVEGEF